MGWNAGPDKLGGAVLSVTEIANGDQQAVQRVTAAFTSSLFLSRLFLALLAALCVSFAEATDACFAQVALAVSRHPEQEL